MTEESPFPLEDIYLRCRDCGIRFVFTRGEQLAFQEKGFAHAPSRCPTCRLLRHKLRRDRPQRS